METAALTPPTRPSLRPGNPKTSQDSRGAWRTPGLRLWLLRNKHGGCGADRGLRAALSVVGAPVAGVAGHEAAGDEQDQVHEPPDAQTPQGEQLPHRRARVAQAEAVHAEAAQEEGVEQRGDEVVPRVPAATHARARQRGAAAWLRPPGERHLSAGTRL